VQWINPHRDLHRREEADGTTENWGIEAGTPNTLFRLGFTRNAVQVGSVIIVDGYESRDGSKRANGRDMTLPDGRKLFMASSVGNDAASKDKCKETCDARNRSHDTACDRSADLLQAQRSAGQRRPSRRRRP